MRFFNKSTKLDNVCYDIRGPVMDEANRMIERGEDILKLNIGNPAPFGFRTPDAIVEEMNKNLEAEETVNEEIKEGKLKKGLKVAWKYTKKVLPTVVTGAGCFVLGRLSKGAIEVPEEIKEAVEDTVENVTE